MASAIAGISFADVDAGADSVTTTFSVPNFASFNPGPTLHDRQQQQSGLVLWTTDDRSYLSQNPDVAAAVAQGKFKSGFDHFLDFGRFEGRSGIG